MRIQILAPVLVAALCACQTTSSSVGTSPQKISVAAELAAALRAELDLPVAESPYTDVRTNWKERLPEEYVFVELRGSYTETARALGGIFQHLAAHDIEPTGAPFALFYDDPGHTPVSELRSRACVPVPVGTQVAGPFAVDQLPEALVVYAYIGGAYGEAPRAYPSLYAYMKKLSWAEAGPIRETYLVSPGSSRDWSDLVCEVQIPAQPTR
ncbi:MAG: GyrI-like domain-containing protein [Planctomycetes bacterium]|nr:GyrI-like domain-containing protein [Planctomycetota bacterium]